METKLQELMQTVVGDPPRHVTAEVVRHRMVRRRRVQAGIGAVAAIAVIAVAIPALTGAFSQPGRSGENGGPAAAYMTRLPDGQGSVYHDPAGWKIDVLPGWHVVSFHSSKGDVTAAGVQIANVGLPAPTIVPGFVVQTSGGTLSAHGVSLVIASDTDPKVCRPGPHRAPSGGSTFCQRSYASLPIGFKELIWGSSQGDEPESGFLWLKADGKALSLSVKFGADVFSQRLINPVSRMIASLIATK